MKHLCMDCPGVICYARSELPSLMPNLETLKLSSEYEVLQQNVEYESVIGGPSHLRQLPDHRHECLKSLEIIGFSYAKALIELTCYIIQNAVSLERLTLNTLPDNPRCSGESNKTCWPISKPLLEEAFRTLVAVRTYIEGELPPGAKLTVVEPCSRCHSVDDGASFK
ncbi:hypothetical protein PR202_gb26234 [Eleusine coracana subsp. coracana]|uniref:At1g61320/AtMIF1 LRR domain-containing protein n=1 Tax=Eleusine coracana subsp. coracana TaxID=191504 RepID=A0AAV5FRC0_ELECO|nr:hypothetical protein PR202_gb26234 [Eleusine coracana subsp. coracana]